MEGEKSTYLHQYYLCILEIVSGWCKIMKLGWIWIKKNHCQYPIEKGIVYAYFFCDLNQECRVPSEKTKTRSFQISASYIVMNFYSSIRPYTITTLVWPYSLTLASCSPRAQVSCAWSFSYTTILWVAIFSEMCRRFEY